MRKFLSTNNISDYRDFLKIKALPSYQFRGSAAIVPDEYAGMLDRKVKLPRAKKYRPSEFLFDYQRDIASLAIRKRRFSIFADCGLGKTLIYAEYLRHVITTLPKGQNAVLVCPLMVVDQIVDEFNRFYDGMMPCEAVRSGELPKWLEDNSRRIAVTNFEAFTECPPTSHIGCIIVDESSMLKSHYGKWGTNIINAGKGKLWKLCGTGTPAPNDRIEYANHAVFMDAFPNVNAFLARYFVNKGQTSERWILKPHALAPFYRSLSHWSIFLTNPSTYGWIDHSDDIPPIHVNIHDVPMTPEQREAVQAVTGNLIASHVGGIGTRSKLGQIAKGRHDGRDIPTNKPGFIKRLVESWPNESTIIWCIYNAEQEQMAATFPDAANITGQTDYDERRRMIADFKGGKTKVLITKPKILGFGLNLQIATRQIFSGLQDSYESYYQAVKRSNRVGSTKPLNVHIPVTEAERPMIETVLMKADRVQKDSEEQERIFKRHAFN